MMAPLSLNVRVIFGPTILQPTVFLLDEAPSNPRLHARSRRASCIRGAKRTPRKGVASSDAQQKTREHTSIRGALNTLEAAERSTFRDWRRRTDENDG